VADALRAGVELRGRDADQLAREPGRQRAGDGNAVERELLVEVLKSRRRAASDRHIVDHFAAPSKVYGLFYTV
jgi:hypothetical protein